VEIITSFFGIAFLIMFLTIFVLTIFVWIFSVIICQENQRKRNRERLRKAEERVFGVSRYEDEF